MTMIRTNAKGTAKMMVAYWSARMPPTASIATVSSPVTEAQTMRIHGAPSS